MSASSRTKLRTHLGVAPRAIAAALCGVLVLAIGLGACGKRIAEVDPAFVFPEGRVSQDSRLILWRETPIEVRVYADLSEPPGPAFNPFCRNNVSPDPGDPQVALETNEFQPTGTINLTIVDHTPSNGFVPMRREANGGYRAVTDFPLAPARKWLENGWEYYRFADIRPSGFTPPTYIGRGTVGGVQGASSTLTNEARLTIASLADIQYTGYCLPCDSLFTLRWNPVPGAFRYWLHVYQLATGVTPEEDVRSARPAPFNDTRPRDILLAYVGDTVTTYKLGDVTRQDIVRLVERNPAYAQTYRVRIAAVDTLGQLIAITRGDYTSLGRGDNYALVRLNAYIVTTKRRTPADPPPGSPGACQSETAADVVGDPHMQGTRRP